MEPTHAHESQFFVGAGYKISILTKFEFWENWLSGIVELIEHKLKLFILCYYTIHGTPRMCPKSDFFRGLAVKFLIRRSLDFEKLTSQARKTYQIYTKNIDIMLLYNSRSALHVPEKSVFSREGCKICIPVMFKFWENGLSGFSKLFKYNQINIYILLLYNSRCPTHLPEKWVFSEDWL